MLVFAKGKWLALSRYEFWRGKSDHDGQESGKLSIDIVIDVNVYASSVTSLVKFYTQCAVCVTRIGPYGNELGSLYGSWVVTLRFCHFNLLMKIVTLGPKWFLTYLEYFYFFIKLYIVPVFINTYVINK